MAVEAAAAGEVAEKGISVVAGRGRDEIGGGVMSGGRRIEEDFGGVPCTEDCLGSEILEKAKWMRLILSATH